jgi:Ca-activated chloride channel family protein
LKNVLKNTVSLILALNTASCSLVDAPTRTESVVVERVESKKVEQDSEYSTYELTTKTASPSIKTQMLGRAQDSSSKGDTRLQMEGYAEKKMVQSPAAINGFGGYVIAQPYNSESYDKIVENSFHQSLQKPLSTFSIDVDTASYSNVRRFIQQGTVVPPDAVRIEELINYFDYGYTPPENGPFSVKMEMAPALWNKKHKLVRIGIKGKEIKIDHRPASNLVFLIDVSGSMDSAERLPLVKSSLAMLADKLNKNDLISIVVYAGAAGLVLPPTTGDQKMKILRSLDQLKAGGSTNGSGGIELAYKTAQENFIKGGVNRIILATDGDFNVGTTDRESLTKLVEKNAKKNIYLSILGFGMGNYKDATMETLSNKGNGNYAYVDNQSEARRVLVEQMSGTLVTIAKDVKIQVEFNPRFVDSYRLVGYENRHLKNEEFNDDQKDAGDIGAGHSVTALYEIIPVGANSEDSNSKKIDSLKYQKVIKEPKASAMVFIDQKSNEWLTVKLRYKKPDGDVSTKMEFPLHEENATFNDSSDSFRFASAVALFGMILRKSEFLKDGDLNQVIHIAKNSKGQDTNSYKDEFIDLVKSVQKIGISQSYNPDIIED